MDVLTIVLGLLCLVLAGAAAWLLMERGRLLAAAGAARAQADGAAAQISALTSTHERELAGLRDQLAAASAALDAAEQESRLLDVQAGELRTQNAAIRAQFEQEIGALRERSMEREQLIRRQVEEARAEREASQTALKESFAALSGQTLKTASEELMRLASERFQRQNEASAAELEKRRVAMESLVKPIEQSLQLTNARLEAMEKERAGAHAGLLEQVRAMQSGNEQLRDQTGKLVKALREPHVRGRYGETQLKRVAELAGMSSYCDFELQSSTTDLEGNAKRPDMVVRLPNERVVVVDAKTNIRAYLEALEAPTPELAEEQLDRFARHVQEQAQALSRKRYWAEYDGSPEFVVMFVPGDQFIDAALQRRPEILEEAARANVLLAGPATLIGLLRAVAVGWREERLQKQTRELLALGKELHERAATAFGHINSLGNAINAAAERFNTLVGSCQTRLEPTLRKFEEAGVTSGKELTELKVVTTRARGTPTLPAASEQQSLLPER
ncbi:MAG: DNA recombination protein RmuC [Planctomycetota bacterium]|nr:DNA recombination protein RmuC [Planctomycetota bacterium]